MFEGLSNIQRAVVVAILILLAALTVWGGWAAITMSTGKGSLGRARTIEFSSPVIDRWAKM
jgi:hypothetical protein